MDRRASEPVMQRGTRRARALLVGLFVLATAWLLPSPAHARGCNEVSIFVGQQKCSRYGSTWSAERLPAVAVALELEWFDVGLAGHGLSASAGSHTPTAYRFDGAALGKARGAGYDGTMMRVTYTFLDVLYAGMHWGSYGFGSLQHASFPADGYAVTARAGQNLSFSRWGGAIAGARLPLGRISVRGEVIASLYMVSLAQDATGPGGTKSYTADAMFGALEPRVYVDVWLTPWITASAFGGVGAVGIDSRMLGLSLAYHFRAFDGTFALW